METSDFGENFHPASFCRNLIENRALLCSLHEAPFPERQNDLVNRVLTRRQSCDLRGHRPPHTEHLRTQARWWIPSDAGKHKSLWLQRTYTEPDGDRRRPAAGAKKDAVRFLNSPQPPDTLPQN